MTGKIFVIGLGPGNEDQITPQALKAVADATLFYGYKPYLDRLDLGEHQQAVASDNREELARAREALDAAAAGGGRGRGFRRRPRCVRHGVGSLRGYRNRSLCLARHRS